MTPDQWTEVEKQILRAHHLLKIVGKERIREVQQLLQDALMKLQLEEKRK